MPRGSSRTPTIYDKRQLILPLGRYTRGINPFSGMSYYGRGPAMELLDRYRARQVRGHLGAFGGVSWYEVSYQEAGNEPLPEEAEAPVRLQRDVLAQPASSPAPDEFGGFFRSPQRPADRYEGPVLDGPWAGQRLSSLSPTFRIIEQQPLRAVPDRAGPGGTYTAGHDYIRTYGWNSHTLGWHLIS